MPNPKLEDAIRALNKATIFDKPINLVAKKMEELEQVFLDTVSKTPEDKEDALPDLVVDVFNEIVKDRKKAKDAEPIVSVEPDLEPIVHVEPDPDLPPKKTKQFTGDPFDNLCEKILNRQDSKLTHIIDRMMLDKVTIQQVFDRVSTEGKTRGLKAFTNSKSEINLYMKFREKSGWKFERNGDLVQLVGIEK